MVELDKEIQNKLRMRLHEAREYALTRIAINRELIKDVYSGNEPQARYSVNPWVATAIDETSIGTLTPEIPIGSVNLLFSTSQTLMAGLFPATPSVRCEPIVGGAQRWAEDQTRLHDFIFLNARMSEPMQRAILLTILNGYAGIKHVADRSAPLGKRTQFEAVDPAQCGWEPFGHRFDYHIYHKEWAAIPKKWQADYIKTLTVTSAIDPCEMFQVTEVYLKGFGGVSRTMAVYMNPDALAEEEMGEEKAVGAYVTSEPLSVCPIQFLKFSYPAHGEDVPPSEALSWMALIGQIDTISRKIWRIASELEEWYLYDARTINPDDIVRSPMWPGGPMKVLIPVKSQGQQNISMQGFETQEPVNGRFRPPERDKVLPDLVASLNIAMAMFREVSGVSELQRGAFPEQFQTATTTQIVQTNAQLRNLFRRQQMAMLLVNLAEIVHHTQREVYGTSMELPQSAGGEGIDEIIVPDPRIAEFAFRVDAVELGHLATRGDQQGLQLAFTALVQADATLGGQFTPWTGEVAQRLLMSWGVNDIRRFFPRAATDDDPEREFRLALAEGRPVAVTPGQNHAAHIAVLEKIRQEELLRGQQANNNIIQIATQAIQGHRILQNAGRPMQSGRTAGGMAFERDQRQLSTSDILEAPAPAQALFPAG